MESTTKSADGTSRKNVLFICTQNSARSQMAEGFLRGLYGDRYEASSAGTHPSDVHPYAIKVMQEVGIDISDLASKSVNEFVGKKFDWVVTICDKAKQICPLFPGGKKYLYRSFEDPAEAEGTEERILSAFRRVRDEIKSWIEESFGAVETGHSRHP